MAKGEAAVRSERKGRAHARILPLELGDPVYLCDGANRRAAHRQAADLRCRRNIAVHQRRRQRQHLRVVVEPEARIVGGEQRRTIDLQREQVSDCIDVLEAVEPVYGHAPGIGSGFRRPVERGLERVGEGVPRRRVRPRAADRRHLPAAQLAYDLLQHGGVGGRLPEVDRVEHEAGRFQPLVVTGYAVPIQEGALRPLRRRPRAGRARRLHGRLLTRGPNADRVRISGHDEGRRNEAEQRVPQSRHAAPFRDYALAARGKSPAAFDRPCIPPELRCSSLTYSRICSLLTPCQPGAWPVSVRRGVSPRAASVTWYCV